MKIQQGKRFRPGKLIFLLVLLYILFAFPRTYLDWLWFSQDLKYPSVFITQLEVKSELFWVGFLFTFLVSWISIRSLPKLTLVYKNVDRTQVQNALARSMDRLIDVTKLALLPASLLIAWVVGSALREEFRSYLLFRFGGSFGKIDPLFHMDLGFYVFKLPFLETLAGLGFGVVAVTLIGVLFYSQGLKSMQERANVEIAGLQSDRSLHILAGIAMVLGGLRYGLSIFELAYARGPLFPGAGYADAVTLIFKQAVVAILVVGGVVTLITPMRALRRVTTVVGVLTVFSIVLGTVSQSVLQRFKVEPNKFVIETPFAARALEFTKFGFGIDKIEARDFNVTGEPTAQEVKDSKSTIDNMRLWDPTLAKRSFEGTQAFKPYYHFADVDIDRYTVNGEKRLIMISPRDIQLAGLSDSARTWVNERLQFTHGYGVVSMNANGEDSLGLPEYISKDIPQASGGIKIDRPQIYFSHFNADQDGNDQYCLANSKLEEFDYPTQDGFASTRWQGTQGIHIDSFLPKLAAAISFQDVNLLVSGNITPGTRLLMTRDVKARAEKVLPFLTMDSDPYIVALNGKLVWILDAYSTSSTLPYSEGVGPDSINYLRNSVKITIDAYTGELNAYAMEPEEPVLKAFERAYPNVVKPVSQAPEGLREHFRYPDFMFYAQASVMTTYHVTDPAQLLSNGDAWQLPYERGLSNQRELAQPYYVQMNLPDEKREGFFLILPLSPKDRGNMNGWLAAHCDPENYGKLVLYRFTKGSLVEGSEQMESLFSQDKNIAEVNRLLTGAHVDIITGNLLVVPIGSSVLYVEPLFLTSQTQGIAAIPALKKIVLGFRNKVVIGDTYDDALRQLFGIIQSTPIPSVEKGNGTPSKAPHAITVEPALAKQLLNLMEKGDAALKQSDFAAYGKAMNELKAKLKNLANPSAAAPVDSH